jgi:hypothetical protein
MQDSNTYLNARWDFIDEVANGTCDYWQISLGDYPRLTYPMTLERLGTPEQPYLIRDARDLGTVWSKASAHFVTVRHTGGAVDKNLPKRFAALRYI